MLGWVEDPCSGSRYKMYCPAAAPCSAADPPVCWTACCCSCSSHWSSCCWLRVLLPPALVRCCAAAAQSAVHAVGKDGADLPAGAAGWCWQPPRFVVTVVDSWTDSCSLLVTADCTLLWRAAASCEVSAASCPATQQEPWRQEKSGGPPRHSRIHRPPA